MATEKRLIKMKDATAVYNGIALYMAENAYLNDTALDVLKMVAEWLNEAPTVDVVEVVHSRFVRIADFGDGEGCFGHCEKCGTVHHSQSPVALKADYRWCRWCGAKMDGDGNG